MPFIFLGGRSDLLRRSERGASRGHPWVPSLFLTNKAAGWRGPSGHRLPRPLLFFILYLSHHQACNRCAPNISLLAAPPPIPRRQERPQNLQIIFDAGGIKLFESGHRTGGRKKNVYTYNFKTVVGAGPLFPPPGRQSRGCGRAVPAAGAGSGARGREAGRGCSVEPGGSAGCSGIPAPAGAGLAAVLN